jgi:hypothetical protein
MEKIDPLLECFDGLEAEIRKLRKAREKELAASKG